MEEVIYKGAKVQRLHPGASTGSALNTRYRLGKLDQLGLIKQKSWLDLGCGDGTYCRHLLELGAVEVFGIDLATLSLRKAREAAATEHKTFVMSLGEVMPFPSKTFDGILLNEVFEHMIDEQDALREVYRVLRPEGVVALMSPNRFFPFEGHGMKYRNHTLIKYPVPLLPWMPSFISRHLMSARNYWPWELIDHVQQAGFQVIHSSPVLMVLDFYPWLPKPMVREYQKNIRHIEQTPMLNQLLGVSTLVVGRRNH